MIPRFALDAAAEAAGVPASLPVAMREPVVETELQRAWESLQMEEEPLGKYRFLRALQERSEDFFFALLKRHTADLMPIIYTPTVGAACQAFSRLIDCARGVFISLDDAGSVKDKLALWRYKDVRVIVITDGERILGLGDQGACGMGIPIGKLGLYTACGGVPPECCLPVTLDAGTNNKRHLEDPLYIGSRKARRSDEAYDALVEEFVVAARELYGEHVLIQWEDFGNGNAFRILAKYRDRICCFNDDIQGTAAVTLAGLYGALRISKQPLTEQKLLFLGSGSAGVGIAHLVASAMEREGMPLADAMARLWLIDSKGLVTAGRERLEDRKLPFAHEHEPLTDLADIVRAIKPTVLVGVSGMAGAFTEEVLAIMAEQNERPIILALSNPTSKAECTAEAAYTVTAGSAIFASGSPFPACELPDGRRFVPGQCNNAYIFPGVGLGLLVSQAAHVPDEMFHVAARALADCVSDTDLELGRVFPAVDDIRNVSSSVAAAVASYAWEAGLTDKPKPDDVAAEVAAYMYDPDSRL
eukprot:PLAT5644.1.p1 GENE.PLAT5644.1~~PLAT5644.1.p1  ORF type:complete len:529 (-),score=252.37 PLAT5644.1:181-1767(-)